MRGCVKISTQYRYIDHSGALVQIFCHISACPPKAATIGPRDLKNSKLVSFWDGFSYGDVSWQRFITRLAAHGPVTPLVPASILQVVNSELIISGIVAEDCKTELGERRTKIEF